MVKKISVVLMVAVIAIMSTCVAYGATIGSAAEVYYSVFDFDYVSGEDFTYPFVGGTVSPEGIYTYGRTSSSTATYLGTANYVSNDAQTGQVVSVSTYNRPSASRWTVHADTVYWDSGYVLKLYDYNDNVPYTDYSVSFEIVDLVDSAGQYEVLSVPITLSERVQGSMIRLDVLINARLAELGYDQRIVRLDNFTIGVEGVSANGQSFPFYMVVTTSVSDSPTYNVQRAQRWLDEYDLPVPSADAPVVATEFLADILEPFLGFEIIPGVSLGAVLAFVATVALVFWFITLLV